MSDLLSVAIFDGIPPQAEGEDPKLFAYWPDNGDINDQLNTIGLYLTFLGFCKDFRASEDCEYFRTDKAMTLLKHIGASVYVGVQFRDVQRATLRAKQSLMQLFIKTYTMFFPMPQRLPDNTIDPSSIEIFKSSLNEFVALLQGCPFMSKMCPSLDLWTLCEDAIANARQRLPTIRSAAFVYTNRLIHTTMDPNDALCLYAAFKAPFTETLQINKSVSESPPTLQWAVGLEKGDTYVPHFRRVTLTDGPAFPTILLFKNLTMIIAFSEPCSLEVSEFQPIESILAESAPKIHANCESAITYSMREQGTFLAVKQDSLFRVTKPMVPNERSSCFMSGQTVENMTYWLNKNSKSIVRVGMTKQEANTKFLFMEKDSDTVTFLTTNTDPSRPMADVMSEMVNRLNETVIG